jgi:ATP-binding cassette, subfamily A (ABC1), member 3
MAGLSARPVRLWLRQTQALIQKILLITLTRHWLSTLIRSIIVPTLALSLILGIQKFTSSGNKYGTGNPAPAQTLHETIPDGAKFFFVQPPGSAADIAAAIEDIKKPLGHKARIETVQTEEQLVAKCPTNINGVTDCYAAVVFNDSPLSTTGSRQWNYTLRISSSDVSSSFDVNQAHVASWNPYLPLQLAVDQAITNSTDVPNTYMFTRTTAEQAGALHRREFVGMILSGLGIICFASMLSHVFHIVGMVASERESGMAQLIDVMGGGAASARVLSFVIAFDIIYLPSWIILGGGKSTLQRTCVTGTTR